MKITPRQYAIALLESLDGKKTSEKIGNFLLILKRRNDLKLLNKILVEFEKEWLKVNNQVKGAITSATKLSEKTKDHVESIIKKVFKAEKVELEIKEDASLIGGLVLRIDDSLIDGSVKSKLAKLERELLN